MIKLKSLIKEEFVKLNFFNVIINGLPWENHRGFTIYEFFSNVPKQGNAFKALGELKSLYGKISVTDIGYKGDNSYNFWKHALSNKMVDYVYDINGKEHKSNKTM